MLPSGAKLLTHFYLKSGEIRTTSKPETIAEAKAHAVELGSTLFSTWDGKDTFTDHYQKGGAWLKRTPRSDWTPDAEA